MMMIDDDDDDDDDDGGGGGVGRVYDGSFAGPRRLGINPLLQWVLGNSRSLQFFLVPIHLTKQVK